MALARQYAVGYVLAFSVALNLVFFINSPLRTALRAGTGPERRPLAGTTRAGERGPSSDNSSAGMVESVEGSKETPPTVILPENTAAAIDVDQALRELEDWTSFPGPDVCGDWMDSYKERHRQMLAREIEGKWLTLEHFRSGLGDNLMGIVTSFVAALVSNRTFLMVPSILDLGFEPAEVDWHVPDFVSTEVTTILRQEIKENGTVFRMRRLNAPKGHGFISFPVDVLEYFQLLRNATNVIVLTNGGVLSEIYSRRKPTFQALHRLGLRMPYAVGCILRFLIKPKRNVLESASKPYAELHAGNASSVCMHFRTSDDFAFQQSEESAQKHLQYVNGLAEAALVCARRLSETWLPSRKPTRWLFLSDSAALVSSLQQKYPGKIMASPAKPMHISLSKEKALHTVVVDWLLFSTCDFGIITQSGFSKTASAYSIKNPYRFLLPIRWDSGVFNRKDVIKCQGVKPHTLLDFRWWSGL